MRWVTCIVWVFLWVVPACADGVTPPASSDGALVLELGGAAPSLRQALVAAGVTPAPPHRLVADESRGGNAEVSTAPVETTAPADPVTPPVAEPPPAPGYRTVELGRGQTLIHLAKQHLGDGNRFRELLALNGWTEADARRLPEGQRVKIPVEATRERPR